MTDFKEFERTAWEEKAHRYDASWGQVSTQVIGPILDLVQPLQGRSLLDCGCGPGHLCAEAVKRGATVTGCDYSHRMLEIAKEKYPNISFVHQDAENLTFPDRSFDVVTMNFLLLHVSNQERTLSEGLRVTAPGGALVFSNWLPPDESPGLALMFEAVKKYADFSVIPPAEDIFLFSKRERCEEFLTNSGFSRHIIQIAKTFWTVSSPEEFFTAVKAGTRIGGLIDLQKPDIQTKIFESINANLPTFRKDNSFHIPTPSLICAGLNRTR